MSHGQRHGVVILQENSKRDRSSQMQKRDNNSNGWGIHWGCLVLSAATAVGSADPAASFTSPTSIFAPASTPAQSIFGLSIFVLAIVAIVFIVVAGLLAYSVVKFRERRDGDRSEPPQIYGSGQIELAWTVIPVLIVLALFLATAHVIASVQNAT